MGASVRGPGMNLAISLATRGRPAQLVDTITRSIANWREPDTRMWVMADADDPATADALREPMIQWRSGGKDVRLDVRDREDTIAAKWNRILKLEPDAAVYSVAADDDPYVTPGYDSKILQAAKLFPDGIGMIYGHLANLSFTGSLSATRKWCEILGYLQPEHFPYWFCDHWTDDLARITGRIAFSDHRTDQSRVGKTQEMREPAWWATFYDAAYVMRRREAVRLIAAMEMPEADRRLRLNNAPLIDQRSRGINENVRQQARQLEGVSGLSNADARYQRIKAKAAAMVPDLLADVEKDNPALAAAFANILAPPTTVPNLLQKAS